LFFSRRQNLRSAGGGIVADSDPQYEFNETVNKAKAIMLARLSIVKT